MNILKLTRFNLKTNKNQILGWGIAIFGIMFLYMILFPSVKDMAQIKMEAMPQELMQFVGVNDFTELNNYVVYFGMIYNLILIAISIFATIFAANIITKEEKNKTIEFLYSLEISRVEIYVSKLVTSFIAVLVVVLAAAVSVLICGMVNGGETFVLIDILQILKISSVTPFIFLSVGIMIAGITTKISGSNVGSGVVILSYILGFLSTMVGEEFQWLKYLSPFEMFKPERALDLNQDILLSIGIAAGVTILFLLIGIVVYKKRDFRI